MGAVLKPSDILFDVTAAAFALRPGDVFHGRYSVVRCIASGGMGAVYEALHLTTRRKCALKVMLPSLVADADLRSRFQTEATIAAQIGSEHIVDVLDAGIDPVTGTPFLVMELLVGEELCDRIMYRGAMPPAEAVELLRQAAIALDRTHAAGIIHRDLKPENFFISAREDGSVRVKILDFGIAKVVAESALGSKQTGTMGTPLYMPPEQVDGTGAISPQADLYAFAQVTYAMLTGEAYFDEDLRKAGNVYGLLTRVMSGPSEPPSHRARRRRNVILPPAFDTWFAKAAARRPEDRFQRATLQVGSLIEALGLPPPPRPSFGSNPDAHLSQSASMTRSGPHPSPLALGADIPVAPALTRSGAQPMAPIPLVTGVPVSADAPVRRAPSKLRWILVGASALVAVLGASALWLVLRSGGGESLVSPAASSAEELTTSASSAQIEIPTASATVALPEPTVSASATATALVPTALPSAAASVEPSASPPKPPPRKRTSVLDSGP